MTKKWFIQFRVWDVVPEKLRRKRVMIKGLRDIRDKDEMMSAGDRLHANATETIC